MHLNEYGLWASHKPSSEADVVKESDMTLCPSEAETDIFRELGMDYLEAGKRNFTNLKSSKSSKKGVLVR
jgi:hypothetical protein